MKKRSRKILYSLIILAFFVFITRRLWVDQLWPDGYYKNLPQYEEEITEEPESDDNAEDITGEPESDDNKDETETVTQE